MNYKKVNQVFPLKDIVRFCNENPNITEINSNIEQNKEFLLDLKDKELIFKFYSYDSKLF